MLSRASRSEMDSCIDSAPVAPLNMLTLFQFHAAKQHNELQ